MGCTMSPDPGVTHEVLNTRWASPRMQDKGSIIAESSEPAPKRFVIRVYKGRGDLVGASLGNTPTGAVIFNIQEGGILDRWNKSNPDFILCPGFIIEEVNGVSGYWNLLEVLRTQGPLVCQISAEPPASAGPNWFNEIATMARKIEQSANKGPFMLRLQPQDPNCTDKCSFSTLPGVKARACGVDNCAICLEDVGPQEMLVQLPCGHAYHALCAARWLAQTSLKTSAKRQVCPLCCRRMVSTPEGGVSCVDGPERQSP